MIINPVNKQFCFSVVQEKQKLNIHSEDRTKANNYHLAKNVHNSFLPTNLKHNVVITTVKYMPLMSDMQVAICE